MKSYVLREISLEFKGLSNNFSIQFNKDSRLTLDLIYEQLNCLIEYIYQNITGFYLFKINFTREDYCNESLISREFALNQIRFRAVFNTALLGPMSAALVKLSWCNLPNLVNYSHNNEIMLDNSAILSMNNPNIIERPKRDQYLVVSLEINLDSTLEIYLPISGINLFLKRVFAINITKFNHFNYSALITDYYLGKYLEKNFFFGLKFKITKIAKKYLKLKHKIMLNIIIKEFDYYSHYYADIELAKHFITSNRDVLKNSLFKAITLNNIAASLSLNFQHLNLIQKGSVVLFDKYQILQNSCD